MTFGLEFAKHRLSRVLSEPVQLQLQSLCLPGGPDVFIDRIDVVLDGATFHSVYGNGSSLEVRLPVDIFSVSMQDLLSHPNQSPPNLPTPADRVVLNVMLAATGSNLSATAVPPDLSGTRVPVPLQGALSTQLADIVNTAMANNSFDAAPMLSVYGLPAPTVVRLSMTPADILVEYDPAGPTIPRTGPGQEWGMFLDAAPALAFGISKLPPVLRSGLISTSAEWSPLGTLPRVLAKTQLSIGVMEFELPLDIRMSIVQGTPALARVEFTWDIEVDSVTIKGIPLSLILAMAGMPGLALVVSELFAEVIELGLDGVAAIAEDFLDPLLAQQGVIKIGDRSYRVETPLPPLSIFGVELRVQSLLAIASGMTLGGAVLVAKIDRAPMRLSLRPFGSPFFPTTCRKHGENPQIHKSKVRYAAGTTFYDCGRFCSAHLLEPSHPAAELIEPALGSADASTDGFGFNLLLDEANTLTKDVRLLVRTARGVRFVNFGKPIPAIVDEHGNVVNVIGHVKDCRTFNPNDPLAVMLFGDGKIKLTREQIDPPLENPGWISLVKSGYGIDVHLITLGGLDPGEQLVFESASHRIQISADARGRAVVPGLAPRGVDMPVSRLSRLNQRPLSRQAKVETLALDAGAIYRAQTVSEVPSEEPHTGRGQRFAEAIRSFGLGELSFVASKGDPTFLWQPGIVNALNPQPLPPVDIGSLNPQPLPPEPPPDEHPLVRSIGLRGVHAVYAVPGTDDHRVAIAAMADGRKLVLEAGAGVGEERARVAGTFEGPIGRTVTRDGFAVAAGGGLVRLFNVQE
ncbi:hypothetical protein [Piscinibacter sp.]|uniref:hypothetical protein n=1 Tax=Piscinibacter sp. TaxID=1903157 RepID=UPI002B906940|nr:hypothetical protein [Albitalea sp.]HUG24313.1 hypothetical protein [Albitalea sp.]